ncbi:uncharacterized protein Z518_07259 [Rhinocladiella mackenziei CBS 650.93]|uniref:Phosphogluconate dehydrogenase NAD-binding putative C-terminal domain-containing protein n=1 Tax=Rhinocladiella mackenziei CBS 650.93 TaxID=1442369 RepID=A0A0D2IKE3_9EURO|nr:uncharacterized protein Z518_07259 [Rhinocladiella mackenziei CBS 650.93]KIX03706.1 hypothetical protein Z518_07259 [Rhinocladiella mackenziei CBS 650.93]
MTTSSSSCPIDPAVGILSIGDMGIGVARLLRHHDYTVYTVAIGRRQAQHTLDRIKSSQIITLDSDEDLVAEADIILSIVPPRDAIATARRAFEACRSQKAIKRRSERKGTAALNQAPSLTYIDLNAISSYTAKNIATMFSTPASPSLPRRHSITRSFTFHRKDSEPELDPISINFLDGGIIGGPPSLRPDKTWKRPSIVISGPKHDDLLSSSLRDLLNVKIVSDKIGPASALKSCFAALSKGFTALSILSFTTAQTCGILDSLTEHLEEFNPYALMSARRGLTDMPPKAYRWVEEMRQINETFVEEGGFSPAVLHGNGHHANNNNHLHTDGTHGGASGVFEGIAEIYRLIADDTVLGQERVEKRKRGTDVQDVAECIREGIARKKRKGTAEEDLDLTWRGSWS